MLTYQEYIHRLYGSFLGMNAGIRLGVPLEPNPWTYEKIRQVFGDIRDYVSRYERFAADDDANGPVYFVRALLDKLSEDSRPSEAGQRSDTCSSSVSSEDPEIILPDLTPEEVGEAWLSYTREGKGMFWWGGVGISTEHTAYMNLKNGIPAPRSGSMEQNGQTMAEQIGGQIFVDTWGMICPGMPKMAALYAVTAASVSHDGEGLHGAAFMAACIAAAFTCQSIREVIRIGLSVIPSGSQYANVVRAVCDFYDSHPDDWHECMEYLLAEWGYDRYPGECHIIPNAGVCTLALCYGQGDFARTIEIAVMCGWDTDCNAGNVGSILGAMVGSSFIPNRYRTPMEDSLVASGISGYLNQIDMPSFTLWLGHAGCLLSGIEEPEHSLLRWSRPGEIHYDFMLEGSTHGFLLSEKTCTFRRQTVYDNTPCLEVDIERVFNGQGPCRIYHPTFFRETDFEDKRYEPVLSPTVYAGQQMSCRIRADHLAGDALLVRPYLTTAMQGITLTGQTVSVPGDSWLTLDWTLPDTGGDWIHEIGLIAEVPAGGCCRLFMADFSVTGGGSFAIDPALQEPDFDEMTPFSLHRCRMSIETAAVTACDSSETQALPHTDSTDTQITENNTAFSVSDFSDPNRLILTSSSGGCAFTGNYYSRDIEMRTSILRNIHSSGGLLLRASGTRSYYFAGFDSDGRAVIGRCLRGETQILSCSGHSLAPNSWYPISVSICGNRISLKIQAGESTQAEGCCASRDRNEPLCDDSTAVIIQLEAVDDTLSAGMVGLYAGPDSQVKVQTIYGQFSL